MFSAIVSASNARVKSAIRLKESRARRRENACLVDGVREIDRALRSHFRISTLFWNAGPRVRAEERLDVLTTLLESGRTEDRAREISSLISAVDSLGAPTIPLGQSAFDKLRFGDRDEGVVAVFDARSSSLDELDELVTRRAAERDEQALVGVVEDVEKPGNLGAILRSADGAGVHGLVVASNRGDYDVFNPNAIRSSLGAIFHVPVAVASPAETLAWLRRRGVQCATALCDESVPYTQLDYTRPTAIILGTEADGLTPVWSEETEEDAARALLQKVRLPMLGVADSLNVSNAAAIFFYEARRTRMASRSSN